MQLLYATVVSSHSRYPRFVSAMKICIRLPEAVERAAAAAACEWSETGL